MTNGETIAFSHSAVKPQACPTQGVGILKHHIRVWLKYACKQGGAGVMPGKGETLR